MPQPLRELVMHAGKQACPHLLELLPFLRLEELVHYALEAALHIQPTHHHELPDIGFRSDQRRRLGCRPDGRRLTFSPESSTAKLVL